MNSDRARGILLGLACGDALGRPIEFSSASAIAAEYGKLDEMALLKSSASDIFSPSRGQYR